jgi:uncharacterized protein YjbJ (UPF0337 family)
MNVDTLKENWKEMKGKVKEKWGQLTDDEIAEAEGQEDKFLGLLQKKYGYTREKAEKEYRDFMGPRG